MKQKRARVERGQGTELSNFRKLTEFYLDTPIVKFVSHVVSTIVVFFSCSSGSSIHLAVPRINKLNNIKAYKHCGCKIDIITFSSLMQSKRIGQKHKKNKL